jgi:hypothetical protein
MPVRSDDTDEISRTASAGDIRRIEERLERIDVKLDGILEKHNEVNVWRAKIDARLAQSVEKMNALEEDIEGCVEKKVLYAWLVGVSCAAGLGGAGLMKLLGS